MSNLPRGLYDQVIDENLAFKLEQVGSLSASIQTKALDPGDGHVYLAQHLIRHLATSLSAISNEQRTKRQVALCNEVINLLNAQMEQTADGHLIAREAQRLLAVLDNPFPGQPSVVERPDTPLATGCLLTGTRLDPSLISQIRKEISSADQVDMLCAFIKWSGIRLLEAPLRQFTARKNSRLRVITTSYMGATDLKAIDFLQQLPNTELRVSYDTHRTRLHAKAYLFHRKTGFGAAYVGSANLSHAALTEGLEWNIKVSQYEQGYLFDKIQATFETYWNDSEFQPYEDEQRERLQQALRAERAGEATQDPVFFFDLVPHQFQEEILQRLDAERELHGRKRQLVVAATGTGKTVLSAFDFRRWCDRRWNDGERNRKRLLFVAHREEILRQALATFRNVLHDANFGELMVAGILPESREQLFVSIQTLNSRDLTAHIPAEYYDYIVIDEFHHAAALSYQNLLEHFSPRVLLGLTATPERMDGLDVLAWFDGHMSAEIRLPDAINNKHLAPFQYFCLSDNVDLSQMRWQRGKYDTAALSNVYTGNDIRTGLIIEKVHQVLTDVRSARGLGDMIKSCVLG